jgi:hypothetical protein
MLGVTSSALRNGHGQKNLVGLKVLYIIGIFFFILTVKQQIMYEITTNTISLAKKE